MGRFSGRYGLQFTVHMASEYRAPEIVALARQAHEHGFSQIWVNDNLRYRQQYVLLAAIAAQVPIQVGTGITVPYFRNPVDLADTLATLSELTEGREIDVGIARGALVMVENQLVVRKPIAMVREMAAMASALLHGERVRFGDFPALCAFYHLLPDASLALAFPPQAPICFFSGANGPKMLAIAGREMDGVLLGGLFISFARLGRLGALLAPAREAARAAGRQLPLRVIAELNVSVDHDRERARDFPRKYATHAMVHLARLGVTDDDLARLGIDRADIERLEQAWAAGGTVEEVARLVPDAMVDACFLAGGPEEVAERLGPLLDAAAEQDVEQVVLSKLGPDYAGAIDLLGRIIFPRL
jgi:5,10-methylenetetrahydromethanopterin reductase